MEPLNHLMSVAQSQNLHKTEPSQTVKHAQQQNHAVEQQHKVQETVTSIPEESNDSQEMMALRGGMGHDADSQEHTLPQKKQEETSLPEKALLQEGSGAHLDIIG